MQKMHITLFQFSFFNSIVNVACNDRLVFLKQFCNLLAMDSLIYGIAFHEKTF